MEIVKYNIETVIITALDKKYANVVIKDAENEKTEKKVQSERDKIATERAALKAEKRAEEQAKRQIEQDIQRKEKERIAAEKEAKRQADLLPDKEKFIIFADMIYGLTVPVLENEEARDTFTGLIKRLYEIARIIKDAAVTL